MEKFAELITILLEHSQKFLDFWNFQILVSLAVLGFVFSEPKVVAQQKVRISITVVFLLIALFTVFSLSIHQEREQLMYAAIQSHVTADPTAFTQEDVAYLYSLNPTPFTIKVSALVFADLIVIGAVWVSPKLKE